MLMLLSRAGASAYLRFVFGHRRLLAFGLVTATLSGFGQTFYLGLFNPELRGAFGLTHGGLGLVYGAATLCSALLLPYLGRLYDRAPLRLYLSAAALVLATGCALFTGVSGVLALGAAFFLLRLGGQGLMGHIALTTMARRFHSGRGKAVSVAAMGFPLAEAVLPASAVAMLFVVDWRTVWAVNAGVVLVVFLPGLLWLLGGSRGGEAPSEGGPAQGRDWTVREVLGDRRFPLLLPAALAPPFVVTVVFFHQMPIAQAKGWTPELVASGLSVFALGHIAGLFGGGPTVDRWSAARAFAPALLPMAASMVALASLDAWWGALLWPGLLGLGMGLAATAANALLAELYGIAHLGAIRSLLHSLTILSTAVGPPLLGVVLDAGVRIELIASALATAIVAAAALAGGALVRWRH